MIINVKGNTLKEMIADVKRNYIHPGHLYLPFLGKCEIRRSSMLEDSSYLDVYLRVLNHERKEPYKDDFARYAIVNAELFLDIEKQLATVKFVKSYEGGTFEIVEETHNVDYKLILEEEGWEEVDIAAVYYLDISKSQEGEKNAN